MTTRKDKDGAGQRRRKPVRGKKVSARTVSIRQRQDQAVRLRAQGLILDEIKTRLGYRDASSVSKAIQASLARTESASAEDLRAFHGERLAVGYRVVSEILTGPAELPDLSDFGDLDEGERAELAQLVADAIERKAELRLKAVDRLVKLMEREARLHGLDAPVKAEVEGRQITVAFHESLRFPGEVDPPTIVDAAP